MRIAEVSAVIAAVLLALLIGFQLLLAAGLPLGRAAWGGRYRILPPKLRLGSLAAAGILGLAAWAVLVQAGLLATEARLSALTGLFAAYFGLNTLGNLASKSSLERLVMTPATLLLAICFGLVVFS